MSNFKLTHARHDRAHCLVPGLFRTIKRGERKHSKLDITYEYSATEKVRFIGFEPLGADDMRVLQGLVAAVGLNGGLLTPEPDTETGKNLRLLMEPKLDAVMQTACAVNGTIYGFLNEIGMTNTGNNIKAFKASLLRMSNVTVVVYKENREASFHLLSYAFDQNTGQLCAALNPRLASAILGKRPHTRIDMNEVRTLNGDPARLIHQRLCGWIDPGKSGKTTITTLCEYVWPNASSSETMRQHVLRVRRSLKELVNLNWEIHEYAKGKLEIRRPKILA